MLSKSKALMIEKWKLNMFFKIHLDIMITGMAYN